MIILQDMYLKSEHRHTGIVGELVRFIEANYPDAVRFKLEVEPENEFAVRCYEKYGYGKSPYFLMTKAHRLDIWTHNKMNQKALESFRVSEERKAYLKTLKI